MKVRGFTEVSQTTIWLYPISKGGGGETTHAIDDELSSDI